MRTMACLLGIVLTGASARAGLYLPGKPDPWPMPAKASAYFTIILPERQNFAKHLIPETLAELEQTLKKLEEEKRPEDDIKRAKADLEACKQLQDEKSKLESKHREGTLTVEEGILLGGYYLLLT